MAKPSSVYPLMLANQTPTDEELQAQAEQEAQDRADAAALAATQVDTPMQPPVMGIESAALPPSEMNQMGNKEQLYALLKKSMGEQQSTVDQLKKKIAEEKAKEEQMGVLGKLDLRPFAEAMRGYGSTTVAQQQAPVDREAIMQGLQDKLTAASQGLTKEQIDQLKAMGAEEKFNAQMGLRKQNLDLARQRLGALQNNRTMTRVFGASSPVVKYQQRIDALDREMGVISSAEKFNIANFRAAEQTIKNAISSLPQGGTGHERMNTYMSNVGLDVDKLFSYLNDNVENMDRNDPNIAHLVNLAKIAKEELQNQQAVHANYLMQNDPSTALKVLYGASEKPAEGKSKAAPVTPGKEKKLPPTLGEWKKKGAKQ